MPSSSYALNASVSPSTASRLQPAEDCCPTCDQPIPRDRAEEISALIHSRQLTHESVVTVKAQAQEDKQKVVDELAEVQRKFEKKTADELGEGAEVNLIESAKKSAELYSFVASAQFTDLLDRIDVQAQDLQALQDDERKAHENLWKKQSIRFRSIQKAGGDLSYRIEMIIGMAGDEAAGNGS